MKTKKRRTLPDKEKLKYHVGTSLTYKDFLVLDKLKNKYPVGKHSNKTGNMSACLRDMLSVIIEALREG